MPNFETNKETLIHSLNEAYRKGQKLEINLRFKGKNSEADQVRVKCNELSDRIDDLITEAMKTWLGTADTLIDEVKGINSNLQSNIRDIKKEIKMGEKILKSIGHLDQAINITKKLLI